jgi:hypothetical protein
MLILRFSNVGGWPLNKTNVRVVYGRVFTRRMKGTQRKGIKWPLNSSRRSHSICLTLSLFTFSESHARMRNEWVECMGGGYPLFVPFLTLCPIHKPIAFFLFFDKNNLWQSVISFHTCMLVACMMGIEKSKIHCRKINKQITGTHWTRHTTHQLKADIDTQANRTTNNERQGLQSGYEIHKTTCLSIIGSNIRFISRLREECTSILIALFSFHCRNLCYAIVVVVVVVVRTIVHNKQLFHKHNNLNPNKINN